MLAEQIDRPGDLVPLLFGQWAYHLTRAENKLALALAGQLEKSGEAENDVRTQLLGRLAKGWTRLQIREFVGARHVLEQCYGLANPTYRDIGGGLSDPYATMLATLAASLTHLGYIDRARSRLNGALSEARRLRQTQTLVLVLVFATVMDSLTRSSEMQKHSEELLSLTSEHSLSFYLGSARAFRGSSLIAIGQVQGGLTLLTQGLAGVRATGTVAGTPGALIALADGYAKLGQPLEGMNYLAEAAQIIETTEQRAGEAYLHRVRGELLNAIGDRTKAEKSYRQALAVAERQRARLAELIAATSLARLWCDEGKRTEARNLLSPIYGWFTEGFDTPVLQDAKTLFDQLA